MRVFISHRSSDGEAYASAIQRELELRNVSAFLYQHHESEITRHSLRIEDFIYPEIEQADCLILVLSPKIFDGTDDPEDWVRLEIEKAQSLNKLIIPVKCKGFIYPNTYPCESIKEIGKTRAIEWKTAYPKTSIQGIFNLLPKQTLMQRLHKIAMPIVHWCRNAIASASTQIASAYNWVKEFIWYNPTVRNWCSRLIFKPTFIFIILGLFLFVIPVFVFGRLDSASSGLRNQLADCYNWGILVKRDRTKANYYYRKSVEADSNAYAMAWVARHAFDSIYSLRRFREMQYPVIIVHKKNEDSMYNAITHLLHHSGDKGYVSAYYDLAEIHIADSEMDLNERYDQALELLNTPNRYNNYDYKGLWEHIVYRIEFQLSERAGDIHTISTMINRIYGNPDYQNKNFNHLIKYIDEHKSDNTRALHQAYGSLLNDMAIRDSAHIMELHQYAKESVKTQDAVGIYHNHIVRLINIDQVDDALDLMTDLLKKKTADKTDSVLYAYLLIEKGNHRSARKILHQLPHNLADVNYLLGKSYAQDNDSLKEVYYSRVTYWGGAIDNIDKEIPLLISLFRQNNILTVLDLEFPRYFDKTRSPALTARTPEIDTTIYWELCKFRQKIMMNMYHRWYDLAWIDTMISRHVQPDRLVYEYEYIKILNKYHKEYGYKKDKDIIYCEFDHDDTKHSEKIAYFYIATNKIRNLEEHFDQYYFKRTIQRAIMSNDDLYKYYYYWADRHGCDSLKFHIEHSRSEHAVYLLEDYNEDDATEFEMQCIAKYGFN